MRCSWPACLAVLLAATSGCAAIGTLRKPPTPPPAPSQAAQLVARADQLSSTDPRAAQSAYQQLLREHPDAREVPQALHGLARLEVDPASPIYDYRSARLLFDRLLRADPDGPYARDARAWRTVLIRLEKCDASNAGLAADLDRLKKLDLDIERQR